MADTTTTNYGLTKPEVGASENTWGAKLNVNMNLIDTQMKVSDTRSSANLPKAGGTMTGALVMGANNITTTGKIYYANMFSQLSDLPSASTYHGMFAHVHATGKGYYAHAGAWIELANQTDLTTTTNTANAAAIKANAAATLTAVQTFTAGQRGEVTALTDATSIATNLALSNNFSVTLAGNRTLANPTNTVAGQSGSIFITQDGTGSRTLAMGTNFKFAGGTAPVLSTAASSIDRLDYVVAAATKIHAVVSLDVK